MACGGVPFLLIGNPLPLSLYVYFVRACASGDVSLLFFGGGGGVVLLFSWPFLHSSRNCIFIILSRYMFRLHSSQKQTCVCVSYLYLRERKTAEQVFTHDRYIRV